MARPTEVGIAALKPSEPTRSERNGDGMGGLKDKLMLEVIERGSGTATHPVPLLFVHGGWHGAWCWENFLDFFADAGYRAVAMSCGVTAPVPRRSRCKRSPSSTN